VTDQGIYAELVRKMISKNQSRIIVNINDLRRKNEQRTKKYCNFLLLFYDKYYG